MKKLNVFLNTRPGEKRVVGQLALSNNRIFFEYDASFLLKPVWLSPFKLPPEPGLKENPDKALGNLFGLFNDSLPDGWGLLLMDRFLRKKGVDVSGLTSIDRLAFLGTSTMGALTYEPVFDYEKEVAAEFDLHDLATQSRQILDGETETVLPQLMRAGGSPGGARPKVLAGVCDDRIISGEENLPDEFQHWIIKFGSENDFNDSGTVEYAYSMMARDAGIDMTETRLFKTNEGDHFFGIRRFDRDNNRRFHVHTFGNIIHADFRIPSTDYSDFFKVIKILTKNHEDVVRGFRQMIFNILANNRDDHVKNVAFMIDGNEEWRLTPAYDLTFSDGPGGEHSMTVMGEGKSPARNDITAIGREAGLANTEIKKCIDQVIAAVKNWQENAQAAGVSDKSTYIVEAKITETIANIMK